MNQYFQGNPKLLKLFRLLGFGMILIGFIGFIGGALISMGFIDIDRELPLGDIQGLATDKDGNIYLGLGFYGYIQKYSNTGKFVGNWKVHYSNGGSFNLAINSDTLLVKTARGDKVISYDLSGKQTEVRKVDDAYDWKNHKLKSIDERGNVYEVDGLIVKRITRKSPNEKQAIDFISTDIIRNILKGPMPSWLIGFLGIFLSAYDKLPFKNKNIVN